MPGSYLRPFQPARSPPTSRRWDNAWQLRFRNRITTSTIGQAAPYRWNPPRYYASWVGSCQASPCRDEPGGGGYFRSAAAGFHVLHFFHIPGSSSILMNTPPITGRARKPLSLAVSVMYQSVNGTRSGVSWTNR